MSIKESLLLGAVRLTDGRGVWLQTGTGQYKYTWYAYGIDASGQKAYSVRTSGIATSTDCDNIAITYTYEVFIPPVDPPAMFGATPALWVSDTDADAARVPLTVVTP